MNPLQRLVSLFFAASMAALISVDSTAQVPNYCYARAISIDHRQVANSDQTDFPVLISGTFSYLATAANGGRVQNANGYDIVFTSDAAGLNRLDHEIDSYDPATGKAAFWIRIPALSHTSDTPIFMWYGSSSISTSQENKPGVWSNHYISVFHFGSSTSLSLGDSTGRGNTLTNLSAQPLLQEKWEARRSREVANTSTTHLRRECPRARIRARCRSGTSKRMQTQGAGSPGTEARHFSWRGRARC